MVDQIEKPRPPAPSERPGVSSRDEVSPGVVTGPTLPAAGARDLASPGTRFELPITNRGYLPGLPLAVLLPTFGDASRLAGLKEAFAQRLKELRETPVDEEEPKDQVSEEAMLNQVLQWITVGEE